MIRCQGNDHYFILFNFILFTIAKINLAMNFAVLGYILWILICLEQ